MKRRTLEDEKSMYFPSSGLEGEELSPFYTGHLAAELVKPHFTQ